MTVVLAVSSLEVFDDLAHYRNLRIICLTPLEYAWFKTRPTLLQLLRPQNPYNIKFVDPRILRLRNFERIGRVVISYLIADWFFLTQINLESIPTTPFSNLWALNAVDLRTLSSSEMPIHGFWGSRFRKSVWLGSQSRPDRSFHNLRASKYVDQDKEFVLLRNEAQRNSRLLNYELFGRGLNWVFQNYSLFPR